MDRDQEDVDFPGDKPWDDRRDVPWPGNMNQEQAERRDAEPRFDEFGDDQDGSALFDFLPETTAVASPSTAFDWGPDCPMENDDDDSMAFAGTVGYTPNVTSQLLDTMQDSVPSQYGADMNGSSFGAA